MRFVGTILSDVVRRAREFVIFLCCYVSEYSTADKKRKTLLVDDRVSV